ncbi:MAG: hypothetical protein AAFN74_25490, partial [Myxococcota bacterium]
QKPLVVMLDRDALPDVELLRLSQQGVAAAVVNVRGQGELAVERDFHYIQNNIILMAPMLVHRAFDLHQTTMALRRHAPERPIALVARGQSDALIGLVAQALWLDFDKVFIDGVMGSWMDAFGKTFPAEGYVHRILHLADIPHFIELARERPLRVIQNKARSLKKHWPKWAEHQSEVLLRRLPSDSETIEWLKSP